MQSIVSPQNWTSCRFEQGPFKAFISFGADPEGLAQNKYLYFVTVTEGEEREIHQEEFYSLSEACQILNLRYKDWNFIDQSAPKSGCSSCVAH